MRTTSALLTFVLLCPAGCDKPDKQRGSPDDNAPLGEPVETVRADHLFDAYQANALGADQKYKGKVLRVAGAGRVSERDGRYFVSLYGAESVRTGAFYPAVIGRIDKAAEADFAKLKAQDAIEVIGLCAGKRTDWRGTWKGYYILIDRCRLAASK